ncbi:DUF2170 family protein [Pseudomonas sp. BCRC 81390]|uniref:YjfI family protein n=1 Tax=Pseudomonas sp. BCRC 81390 TaxID=3054778 RepID=UPI00338DAFE5
MCRRREALDAAGLVQHEAYVPPENKPLLKEAEKRLRQPLIAGKLKMELFMTEGNTWNTKRLFDALNALASNESDSVLGSASLALIEGAEQAIKIDLHEFGGLPVFIVVAGEQIIVDTLLIEAEDITDVSAFNDAVLRSREMFPLSSIGIETMPNGETAYNMFGALTADSSLTNVVTEILTLAENVQRAVIAFESFFSQ